MKYVNLDGRRALAATPANMRAVEETDGVFAYSPVTSERYSATAGDYFEHRDEEPLVDSAGEPMILARERCQIIPLDSEGGD